MTKWDFFWKVLGLVWFPIRAVKSWIERRRWQAFNRTPEGRLMKLTVVAQELLEELDRLPLSRGWSPVLGRRRLGGTFTVKLKGLFIDLDSLGIPTPNMDDNWPPIYHKKFIETLLPYIKRGRVKEAKFQALSIVESGTLDWCP